jgi:protein-tyrosine phosphatase
MVQVLNWQTAPDPRAVIRQAVAVLAQGRLVAFPTETVYGLAASALLPEAVERLRQSKGRTDDKPLTLAIGGAGDALDWVPGMSQLGRRLARRCWPGPVTLVFADGVECGLASRLPEPVRRAVSPAGTLGLRVPAHEAVLEALRHLPGPLALTSANAAGAPAATTADQVVGAVGDCLDLVIDDGPSHYGQASTVVQVNGNRFHVLREGVVSAADLEQLSPCLIVFVCTGNTCRSPLAEALCKKRLAERLECPVEELPQRGFVVLSAGLAAMMGGRAAEEAVEVARDLGADLARHCSQPLTADLAARADYLITMTHSHQLAVAARFGRAGARPRLLSPDGADVADPIGCDQQVYRECAQQILRHLEGLVPELQQP